MEYIEKPNLFFVYDAKAEVQKRICSGQFTIVDDDFATLGFKCGVDYVVNIINEAEVKDVKPVIHAHWKPSKEPKHEKEFSRFFVCTNCSHDIQLRHAGIVEDIGFEYCPHCGAKMDEAVE